MSGAVDAPELFDGQFWRGPNGLSIAEVLAELKRELEMRRSVYPRWRKNYAEGRRPAISEAVATWRIHCIEDGIALLEANIDK